MVEPINIDALIYDPLTGDFTRAGRSAGCVNRALGYRIISVGGKPHYAHRLAFIKMTGAWPQGQVDHIDGNRSNNRWSNLRDVSQADNLRNVHAPRKDNTLQVRGVRLMKGRYQTRINRDGKCYHLGTFDTLTEAASVYEAAKKRLHPEAFVCG